jgi:hypothetical protein
VSTTIEGPPVQTEATVITEDAATQTTTVAGAQAAVDRGRQYMVLGLWTNNPPAPPHQRTWVEIGTFEARTSDEAASAAATREVESGAVDSGSDLTYVAIPVRSFQPVELTAKIAPKIEFRGR